MLGIMFSKFTQIFVQWIQSEDSIFSINRQIVLHIFSCSSLSLLLVRLCACMFVIDSSPDLFLYNHLSHLYVIPKNIILFYPTLPMLWLFRWVAIIWVCMAYSPPHGIESKDYNYSTVCDRYFMEDGVLKSFNEDWRVAIAIIGQEVTSDFTLHHRALGLTCFEW